MEVLKALTAFPSYMFSSDGRILSKRSNRFLKPLVTPNGYHHVVLCEGGMKRRLGVHRLIATAFHGQPPMPGAVASHLNDTPGDNRASNLEWCTQSQNVKRAYATGRRTINAAHRERCAAMGRAKRGVSNIVKGV